MEERSLCMREVPGSIPGVSKIIDFIFSLLYTEEFLSIFLSRPTSMDRGRAFFSCPQNVHVRIHLYDLIMTGF